MSARQRRLLPALAALLLAAARLPCAAQPVPQRFADLARELAPASPGDRPEPRAVEAMELAAAPVISALRSGHAAARAERAAKPFVDAVDQAARGADNGATGYTWMRVAAARRGDLGAVVVTYGAASRLALLRLSTGKRLTLPAGALWQTPWSALPRFADDTTLALSCDSVQDMGMRTGMRLDTYRINGDAAVRTGRVELARTLEWGGCTLRGDRAVLSGLQMPEGFFTTAPVRLFEVRQEWRLNRGRATLVRQALGQPELRAIDAWIVRARAARKPSPAQVRFRAAFPEPDMLDKYRRSGPARRPVFRLEMGGTARFTLERRDGRWSVVEVRTGK